MFTSSATGASRWHHVSVARVALSTPDCHGAFEIHRHHRSAKAEWATYATVLQRRRKFGPLMSVRRGAMAAESEALPFDARTADPRHVFRTAGEVMARYRWGRFKGYEQLQRGGFPKPIAGRYRLDQLMQWEDDQLADSTRAATSHHAAPPTRRRPSQRTDT